MTDPTFKGRAGLERWGFHWQGHDHGTHVQMYDGFWTPWHIADAELTRLRAENEALRPLVAKLYCASGCSCCRDCEAWDAASNELGAVLKIPAYDDGSGYDWYSVRDEARQLLGDTK